MKRSTEFVTSFEKGLSVIQAFGPGNARMTLTEVAEACGQTRASARRFLLTLTELGFAATDGKHFELTPRVLNLGYAFLASQSLNDLAQPLLERVTQELDESCSIGMLDEDKVVYVARSAGRRRIMSLSLQVGTRLPAFATSMGQVLMSHAACAVRDQMIQDVQFEAFTSRTLSSKQALRDRLDEVHRRGYALVDGELEEGLRSLAVPVVGAQGKVMAAMNVSTQSSRVDISDLTGRYLRCLQDAAADLGRAYGN